MEQSSTVPATVKVRVYVPPRIDDDLYQALVPPLSDCKAMDDKRSTSTSNEAVFTSSDSNSQNCIEFLCWFRNFYGIEKQTEIDQSYPIDNPLYNDSYALEYLSLHKYDVGKACFHLNVNFSHGKDRMIANQLLSIFEKLSGNAAYFDYKDRAKYNQNSGGQINVKSTPLGNFRVTPELSNMLKSMKTFSNGLREDAIHKVNDIYWPDHEELLLPISHDVFLPTPPPPFSGEDENSNPATSGETILVTENNELTDEVLYEKVLLCMQTTGSNLNNDVDDNGLMNSTGNKLRTSSRSIATEKLEIRKRWQNLLARVAKLWGNSRLSTIRPSLNETMTILDEAVNMPIPFNIALCSTGSSAQASEDFSSIEAARNSLGDLVKKTLSTRIWVADVRDTLYRNSLNGICVDGNDQQNILKVSNLEALLNQGKSLDVGATSEEKYLQQLISELLAIISRIRTLFVRFDVSPLLHSTAHLFPQNHTYFYGIGDVGTFRNNLQSSQPLFHQSNSSFACGIFERTVGQGFIKGLFPSRYNFPYSPIQLERMLSVAVSHKIDKLPLKSCSVLAYVLSTPEHFSTNDSESVRQVPGSDASAADNILGKDVAAIFKVLQIQKATIDKISSDQQVSINRLKKVPLLEIEKLLHDGFLNNHLIPMNEFAYFEEVYKQASQLQQGLTSILHFFENAANQSSVTKKEKGGSNSCEKYLIWDAVLQIAECLGQYPVALPAFPDFLKYLKQTANWRRDVLSLVYEVSSDESFDIGSSKRRSGNRIKEKSSNDRKVSIQRIEALMKEGDSLPFSFQMEMSILTEKKTVALDWLDKLTRTFSQPKRSRAKQTEDINPGSKLSYEEMKQMLEDGKVLYLQANNTSDDSNSSSSDTATNSDPSGSSTIKGIRNVNRDLNRAAAALEAAENWMSRVHGTIRKHYQYERKQSDQLLNQLSLMDNNLKFEDKIFGKCEESENDGEVSDIDSDDGEESDLNTFENKSSRSKLLVDPTNVAEIKLIKHRQKLISMLSSFLSEAENLAIVLDESEELKFIIQSLDWAIKSRRTLQSLVTSTYFHYDVEKSDVETCVPKFEGNTLQRLRVSEILQMKQDISKIRGVASYAALPEEKLCLCIADHVEKFLTKVKKYCGSQYKEIKGNTPLNILKQLIAESIERKLSINFDFELRAVRLAVSSALFWIKKNATILESLNLLAEEDKLSLSDHLFEEVSQEVCEEVLDESKDKDQSYEINDLEHLLQSSSHLITDFQTLRNLKDRLRQCESWYQKLSSFKLRIVSFAKCVQNALTSPFRASFTTNSGNQFGLLASVVQEVIKCSSSAGRSASAKRKKEPLAEETDGVVDTKDDDGIIISPILLQNMITFQDIQSLITERSRLGVEFPNDIRILELAPMLIQQWGDYLSDYLESKDDFPAHVHSLYLLFSNFLSFNPAVLQWPFVRGLSELQPLQVENVYTDKFYAVIDAFEKIEKILCFYTDQAAHFCFVPSAMVHRSPTKNAGQNVINDSMHKSEHFEEEEISIQRSFMLLQKLNVVKEIFQVFTKVRGLSRGEMLILPSNMSSGEFWADIEPRYLDDFTHVLSELIALLDSEVFIPPAESSILKNEKLIEKFTTETVLKQCLDSTAISTLESLISHRGNHNLSTSTDFTSVQDEPITDGNNNDQDTLLNVNLPKKRPRESDDIINNGTNSKSTRTSTGTLKKKADSDVNNEPGVNDLVEKPSAKRKKTNATLKNNSMVASAEDERSSAADRLCLTPQFHRSFDILKSFYHATDPQNSTASVAKEGATEDMRCVWSNLLRLLYFWLTIVRAYQARVQEASLWKHIFQLSRSSSLPLNVDSERNTTKGEVMISLIEYARRRDIRCLEREQLEQTLKISQDWLNKARLTLQFHQTQTTQKSAKRMTVDEFKDFLKDGENVIFEHDDELSKLRQELKRYKQWKTALDNYLNESSTSAASQGKKKSATATTDAISAGGINREEECQRLVQEGTSLVIDVAEYLEPLQQQSTYYCLCRQFYFGQMIGCDTCEDWYHLSCVHLNESQVQKCDHYVCVRCALKNSFVNTVNNLIFDIVFKWISQASLQNKVMNKQELLRESESQFRQHDQTITKLQKKLAKEFADLEKIKQVMARSNLNSSTNHNGTIYASSNQSTSQSVSSTNILADSDRMPIPTDSTSNSNVTDLPSSTNESTANRLPSEFLTIQASVQALQSEIDKRQKIRHYELANIEVIQNFMKEVAWLVKPHVVEDNADVMQLGAPLSPEIPLDFFNTIFSSSAITSEMPNTNTTMENFVDAKLEMTTMQPSDTANIANSKFSDFIRNPIPDHYPTYGLQMRDVSFKMSCLLPPSVQNLYDKANAWQISQVEDVVMVKDAFRWLSWCNLVLHVLRYPASTPLLRHVLDETKSMRVVDDKIVKLLSQVLSKASSWKQKARKLLSNSKKLDESKLTQLLLEGNNLPFTSRLKSVMKKSVEQLRSGNNITQSIPSAIEIAQTSTIGPSAPAASTLGKRKHASRLSTSSQGESGVGEINSYNSTDDEETVNNWHATRSNFNNNQPRKLSIRAEEIPPTIREWYQFYSYPTNVMKLLASVPNNHWPVGMNFPSSDK